jgi:hypothetical protein
MYTIKSRIKNSAQLSLKNPNPYDSIYNIEVGCHHLVDRLREKSFQLGPSLLSRYKDLHQNF